MKSKKTVIALVFVAGIVAAFVLFWNGNENGSQSTKVNVRLQWIPQSQFAGFIVAEVKGYYDELGLDVDLLRPDLKPHVTVAAGTDHFGIGVPNQILAARSNGVPLIAIAQIFQDSPNRYVLKAENRIEELQDLKGKKVGLWLGGDEVEFIAMLKSVGVSESDVTQSENAITLIVG